MGTKIGINFAKNGGDVEKSFYIYRKMDTMKGLVLFLCGFLLMLGELSAQCADGAFTQQSLSDTVFSRIRGKSYAEGCTLPREDLRYLQVLHYNKEGEVCRGELVCHKDIAADLLAIFRRLYEARYPIGRMVLVDEYGADDEASMRANNSSAFNFRFISGTRRLSAHSRGMAVDINPKYNPYVRRRNGRTVVSPEGSDAYADRTKDFPYKIERGDLCHRLFTEYGFVWGGDWKNSKDYQHFEKR